MKNLQESLLDNDDELFDRTDYLSLLGVPKYSDLNTKTLSRPPHWGRDIGTVNKSYEWNIPKDIRKDYVVKGNRSFKIHHDEFTPYKIQILIDPAHQHLGLKLHVTEINEYGRNAAEEYYIKLYIWDIPSNIKNKYRLIAYNVLELIATYKDSLQYILIDKENNPRMDYYFYEYGINVNDLFKKYKWKIKKYK